MTDQAVRQHGTMEPAPVTVGQPENDTRICALEGCDKPARKRTKSTEPLYCSEAHRHRARMRRQAARRKAAGRSRRPRAVFCVREECGNPIPPHASSNAQHCSKECATKTMREATLAWQAEQRGDVPARCPYDRIRFPSDPDAAFADLINGHRYSSHTKEDAAYVAELPVLASAPVPAPATPYIPQVEPRS